MLVQIREENPRLARDSKILKVTMDNVYEVFTTPRDVTGLQVSESVLRSLVPTGSTPNRSSRDTMQGIHFRFMPDVNQVKHALQVG